MGTIRIKDKTFKTSIPEAEIMEKIKVVADRINKDMEGKNPLLLAVLNGSFIFAADLMRNITIPCEISFVKLASYQGTTSTGKIKEVIGLNEDLTGRTVVIVEDIVDTGTTMKQMIESLGTRNPKSVHICSLLVKPEKLQVPLNIEYVAMEIPNDFIVGYGLDFDEIARNLPQVYQLNTSLTMTNLVLFGKPGAGKGTQAAFLKDKYNLVHISTGDIFRYNIKNETKLGKLAQSYMDKGDLVPDEVTIQMLQEEVEKNPNAEGFIFDGFPRTIAQAEALDAFLTSKGMRIHGTLALEADDEALIKRLVERGKVSGRTDDQDEEKIRNRFTEYNEKTAPLIAFYQAQGKYHPINGIGTIEEITTRLSETIDKIKAE